ncbi:MAG: c-type cytochrome [Acidobacteria bacterium]|nr:c-type cytochrome [Acidobacteriota bacterium]
MLWFPLLAIGVTPYLAAIDMPAQAARGKQVFLDGKTACSICHELDKQGNRIGPDLTKVARLSPKAIVVSILSTRTVYAQEVELKINKKFPAMIVSDQKGQVKLYNLDRMPPEFMELDRSVIHAVRDNATWKHPPESAGYADEQLADVIAYIRYVALGDTKGVNPEEVK